MDKTTRREVVLNLIKIGLSCGKISKLLGISLGMAQCDVSILIKEEKLDPKRRKPANVFGNALKAYGDFQQASLHGRMNEFESCVLGMLQAYLNMADFYLYLSGLDAMRERLLTPVYPANLKPYADFVSAVFYDRRDLVCLEARYCFDHVYLGEILDEKRLAPESYERMKTDFADCFLGHFRNQIVPIWPPYVSFVIDKVLEEGISEKNRQIIRSRFGIGSKKKTLNDISRDMEMSMENVRQRLKKIMKNIRINPVRFRVIHLLWNSGDLLGEALAEDMPNQAQVLACELGILDDKELDVTIEEYPAIENLLLPVQRLELSTRAKRAVVNTECLVIGELVTKTDWEMLRMKNIGRKSLVEIKKELAKLDLTFGMRFSGNIEVLIEEERRRQKEERGI